MGEAIEVLRILLPALALFLKMFKDKLDGALS